MRMRTRAGLRAGDGAAAGGDFTSGRVCEWRAGLDANFSLTGVNIDTVKVLNNGDTDLDIIYVGGGGYTTKAQHDADNPIDTTKTIDVIGSGDYQLRAAGLLSDMIPVDGSDFGILLIVKVDTIVNAFGAKDVLMRLQNGVEISFYDNAGTKKVFVSMDSVPSTAEATITLGQWLIIRVNHDASKARVTVGDGTEVVAAASTSGAFSDGRPKFFADIGTAGYMDGAVFLIRAYNAKITDAQWSQLKSYWRGQFADIA